MMEGGVAFLAFLCTLPHAGQRGIAYRSILTSDRLNALPEELTAALKRSAERTDPKGSNAVIDRIRKHDEPFSDTLTSLTKKYRFDIIQELFEEGIKNNEPK